MNTYDKEMRKIYNDTHYAKNKETINSKRRQIIQCECGKIITVGSRSTHLKSLSHKKYTVNNVLEIGIKELEDLEKKNKIK